MNDVRVTAGRRKVTVGNAEKTLFDDPGVTKRELAAHYRAVASRMLPHLRGRPLALQRFPDGVSAQGFMQKKVPDSAPEWLGRVIVPRERGGEVTMVVCDDAASLVYLADQAVVTLHPLLSRGDRLTRPDRMIFDLDPSDHDFGLVRSTAIALHELLDELELPSFVMTTGSRGLHVSVPLDRGAGFDDVRTFASKVADLLCRWHSATLTTEVRKDERRGRLFIDTLRNAYTQHAVAPYSVRPLPGAPVATPLYWAELDDQRLSARRWGIRDIEERLSADDPWRGFGRRAHALGPARRRPGKTSIS